MIDGKAVLAIIPARGGSKGLPRKNIIEVMGKPIIAWTIEEAKKSRYIDRLILSSEDDEIIKISKNWGCEVPFVRPLSLAKDDSPVIEAVLHSIHSLPEKYDYIVLLQPTSPLRTSRDIDGSIELCVKTNAPTCVTVNEPDTSPYWMFFLDENGRMRPVMRESSEIENRRQDLQRVYALNGACYVAKRDWITMNKTFIGDKSVAYKMDKERSLDIDDESDLKVFFALSLKTGGEGC